jgi:hypothetical protein
MQTSISLQEGPQWQELGFLPEDPRAQTGLRGGKLCAQYAGKRYLPPASDSSSTRQCVRPA